MVTSTDKSISTHKASKPVLIVSVDTEEEGLWNGDYRVCGNTVQNVRGAARFQELCNRHGIKPTYLVDTPVVDSDECVELLGGFQQDNVCEIGAHLHPWCAPPFEEETNRVNSFLCNLPTELQRQKLTRLTDRIEQRFGRRPTSFRAGRYGLDGRGAAILVDLGYQVDSSVIAFSDFSAQGGPNFMTAPVIPYAVGQNGLCAVEQEGPLLEVPVSVGYNRVNFAAASRIQRLASGPLLRHLHLVGVLDRMGLLRRIKFSPEQADAARMKRLADVYVARRAPCIVMMLHSSSLVPGYSPYVPTANALDQMMDELAETFRYCLGRHDMVSMTLTEFSDAYREAI